MSINQWQPLLSSALLRLQSFAQLDDSEILLQTAFGADLSFDNLLNDWREGRWSSLPKLELITAANINGAQGAFAGSTNTLYLSQELWDDGDLTTLTQVFLEEYGHYLDNQLNQDDTPGDEGEYFAALAMGQALSDSDILRLRSENDWATVMLGGQLTAIEQSFNIVQLTSNNFDDGVDYDFYLYENDDYGDKLKVSGTNIAWQSDEGVHIFNGFIPRRISDSSTDKNPQIQGNSVVWDGDSGIYLYDGQRTSRLIGSDSTSSNPQVYGRQVVWENRFGSTKNILFYDGVTTNQLTDSGATSSSSTTGLPRIYENNIVWSSRSFSIYLYNGNRILELSDLFSGGNSPVVSDELVAWTDGGGFAIDTGTYRDTTRDTFYEIDSIGFYDVYVQNLNTGQTDKLSTARPIRDLQVSNSYAAWQEGVNENTNSVIMFYDGSTIRNLSSDKRSSQWDSNPKLFGNKVVWERWDGIDYEIMYYDGSSTRQVTNNNRDDRFPQVSNEIIAWTGYDGTDWEIYQTYIGPDNGLQDKLTTTLIRFQNTDRPGTYLYAGEQEAVSIRQNYPNFVEEGAAFRVATSQTDPLLQPFYRFRNTAAGREGTYLFAGAQEAVSIRQNYPNFIEEGIAFYTYPGGVGGGITNFNRFQNNELPGTYLFAGPSESGSIVGSNYPFTYEGPAFAAG